MTLVGQNGIPGLVELRGVSSVQFEQLQVGSVLCTFGSQNHEKLRFYTPQKSVITAKNEGFGFPWYIYIYINIYHYKLYTKNLKELSFSLHSIVKPKGVTNALKNLDIGGPLEMCQVCKWVTCQ